MQDQCKFNARSMQVHYHRGARPLPNRKGRRQTEVALARLLGKWRQWNLSVMFLDINQHQCRQFKSTLTSVDFQCPLTVKQFSNIFRRSEHSNKDRRQNIQPILPVTRQFWLWRQNSYFISTTNFIKISIKILNKRDTLWLAFENVSE